LRVTALTRIQVERDRRDLVHDGHRSRVSCQIDAEQVAPARVTGFDAHARKDSPIRTRNRTTGQATHHAATLARSRAKLAEDAQPRARVLSTSRARHACVTPRRRTSRAHEASRTAREVVGRPSEEAELRRPAALRAVASVARSNAFPFRLRAKGLEHGAERSPGEESIDRCLLATLNPLV